VYEALRRDIVEMTLAPGDPVDETRLSKRFNLSRTPIREALVRLAAEGFVATLPNRNTVVAAIDFASMPVYFDALVLMYRVTTRLAAMRRTEPDLKAIRTFQADFAAAVKRADAFAMIAVNRDFHVAIAEAGRNPYFTQLFSRLLDEGRRLLRLYYSSYDDHRPPRFVDAHDAIVKAIEAGDAERADSLAHEHAMQVVHQIQSFLTGGVADHLDLSPPPPAGQRTRVAARRRHP
jgi:DNA-binding GntR family transcriptional regulator